jgi:hypothetical protein
MKMAKKTPVAMHITLAFKNTPVMPVITAIQTPLALPTVMVI